MSLQPQAAWRLANRLKPGVRVAHHTTFYRSKTPFPNPHHPWKTVTSIQGKLDLTPKPFREHILHVKATSTCRQRVTWENMVVGISNRIAGNDIDLQFIPECRPYLLYNFLISEAKIIYTITPGCLLTCPCAAMPLITFDPIGRF